MNGDCATLLCQVKHGFQCFVTGQERFTSMTRVYYKDAHACIVMFDLTQRDTFQNSVKWKKDLDTKCSLQDGSSVPCLLLANKVISYLVTITCVIQITPKQTPFCKLIISSISADSFHHLTNITCNTLPGKQRLLCWQSFTELY